MRHKILYLPGLGDHAAQPRHQLLWFWQYRNATIEVVPLEWYIDEPWADKQQRLLKKIDGYIAKGYRVSLIGESAGATAALLGLRQRSDTLTAVVLLCGKSQYPDRVSPRLYSKNPAFKTAITESSRVVANLTNVEKQKILNIHPLYDPVVSVWETKIPGVQNVRIPTFGHATSIALGATLWNFIIVRFVRKSAKKSL